MASPTFTLPADRPSWRGWIHAVAFFAAIPGGVVLILAAQSAAAVVGASVYTAGLLLGFGTSAAYHRLARSPRALTIMQRLDHSMIFVLIAATYTPVCLLAMPPAWGIPILCVAWTGALLGVVMKQFAFQRLAFLEYALYPLLGWIIVIAAPVLLDRLTTAELVLVRERPDPWPRTFGYHEIWHAFTVCAGACHFATVGLLLR
jgi:hemolysin III